MLPCALEPHPYRKHGRACSDVLLVFKKIKGCIFEKLECRQIPVKFAVSFLQERNSNEILSKMNGQEFSHLHALLGRNVIIPKS